MQIENNTHNDTLCRRLSTYPEDRLFRLFGGKCYSNNYNRAELLEKILAEYFKSTPASEQEYLLKAYDHGFLLSIIRNWATMKYMSREMISFLYDKIKFKKEMFLNIPFNQKDFMWPEIWRVFNEIFTTGNEVRLKRYMSAVNESIHPHILNLYTEVQNLKKEKTK